MWRLARLHEEGVPLGGVGAERWRLDGQDAGRGPAQDTKFSGKLIVSGAESSAQAASSLQFARSRVVAHRPFKKEQPLHASCVRCMRDRAAPRER
eukprot:3622350-Pleurochrysis_carterae.AAC.2